MIDWTLPPLLLFGAFLLAGWVAHAVGARAHVPRVTLLLLIGLTIGPAGLDLVPAGISELFPYVAQVALTMVGFLLGERLAGRELQAAARNVLAVSVGATLGPALAVSLAVWLVTVDPVLALLLGGIATATAPAATVDVVNENGARGPLTDTVVGVVAIDDAWGVMLFSVLLVLAGVVGGSGAGAAEIGHGIWDIVGALALGCAVGVPMARFTGRRRTGEPTLVEAAGFVLTCGGLAIWLDVSYLLAAMALGATVALRARHYIRPFREMQGASEPFLVIFFILAGFELQVSAIVGLGSVGLAYLLARGIGKVAGGWLAARAVGAPRSVRQRVGWCLLSQAGVALGLALVAAERFPALGDTLLTVVVATTVFFELFGPFMTRWQLERAGEIGERRR